MPFWMYTAIRKIRIQHHISITAMENNAALAEKTIPVSKVFWHYFIVVTYFAKFKDLQKSVILSFFAVVIIGF